MKVLFAVWELDPFFKMGGLGDVARSLPGALKTLGVDIRIVTPYYKVEKMGRNKKNRIAVFSFMYANKKQRVEIWEIIHPYTNVPVYFLKNKKYLDKPKPLDIWGFFDKAVVEILKNNLLHWQPDILHLNEYHCGLIPLLIKTERLPIKTIMTIHNLAYQGDAPIRTIEDMGIDTKLCRIIKWEIKSKQINFMMEGLIHSDVVTVVSPTYAKEILSEEYGQGLEEVLRGMEGKIFGILNGIDADWRYNNHDKSVKFPYNHVEREIDGIKYLDWKEGKKLNKRFLQKKLGLKVDENIPLLSFIGRIDPKQKGLDIMHNMLRRNADNMNFEFVILGAGDKNWEERYRWLSTFYPKNISCNFKFDEALAHQMYAGSDFIVIPSLYEPCGLIQMIAMLFGTIPIAHKTGGLIDSIKDNVNGFLFADYSSEALERAVNKAINLWKNDKVKFSEMVDNAFNADFSWKRSAQEYLNLYQKLLA
jgi:starch synthase